MTEKLSRAEINKRYDKEWVLLGEPEYDKRDQIKRAVVLAHSPNRNYVFRRAMKLQPKSGAFFWIGDRPDIIAAV